MTEKRTVWQLARLADCTDPDTSTSDGAEFLRGVEYSTVEAFHNADFDERADSCWIGDTSHEIADSCVPVYTHEMWSTFADLAAWNEDPSEYGTESDDMTKCAMVCLYMIGQRLASALLEELETTCWDVGSNMPGYLPESEPYRYTTFDGAKRSLIEEMLRDADSAAEIGDEETAEALTNAAEEVNLWSEGPNDVTIGNRAYWIESAEV